MGVSLFYGCGKGYIHLHPPAHKEKLNELGKQGWELVALLPISRDESKNCISMTLGKIERNLIKGIELG